MPVHIPKKRTKYDELPVIPARHVETSTIVKDVYFEKHQPFDFKSLSLCPSIPKRYNKDLDTSISYQIFDLLQDLPNHSLNPSEASVLPVVRPTRQMQQSPPRDDPLPNRRRRNWPDLVGRRNLPTRNCRSIHMRDREAMVATETVATMGHHTNEMEEDRQRMLNQYEDIGLLDHIPTKITEFALEATELGDFVLNLDTTFIDSMSQAFTIYYSNKANEYALMTEEVMRMQRIPRTFWEAVKNPNSGHFWQQAAKKEIAGWITNQSYEMVELPKEGYALNHRWLFSIKYGPDGRLLKHKARVVVRGDNQREGIDYADTFAPVGKMPSFRLLFSKAVQEGRQIHHLDVSTAFLAAPLEEEIFMQIPPGFPDLPAEHPEELNLDHKHRTGPNGRPIVIRLLRAAYGLKQAPHQWNQTFDRWAYEIGYRRTTTDHSVYTHRNGSLMIIWVDDILILDKDEEVIGEVKSKMAQRFSITDLGQIRHYLNMNILRGTNEEGNRYLFIHQEHFIDQLLKEHGMEKSTSKETPMATGAQYDDKSEDLSVSERSQYISIIGSLNYIVHTYRADIAYATNFFSRFSNNPKQHHMKGVKRILAYLKGTKEYGLYYEERKSEESQPADIDGFTVQWRDVPVTGFGDADFANGEDRKSISGYCFFHRGNLVSWASKKQSTVATSTVHAEYVAASLATREACWLRSFLYEIDNHREENSEPPKIEEIITKPVLLYTDSQGAFAIASNPIHHQRTKHFDIHHHYIRERVALKHVSLQTCSTSQQIADIFTKPLPPKLFHTCRMRLGLRTLQLQNMQKEQWRHRF